MAEQPAPFAGVLRELRDRLSQEKRTEAPGLSPRATCDPKRVASPHKDTVRLLGERQQVTSWRWHGDRQGA